MPNVSSSCCRKCRTSGCASKRCCCRVSYKRSVTLSSLTLTLSSNQRATLKATKPFPFSSATLSTPETSSTLSVFQRMLYSLVTTSQLVSVFQGGYAGNALGFKVSSLSKIRETRSNVPRVTLLHYMVTEAQQQNERVIEFAHELSATLQRSNRLGSDISLQPVRLKSNR